MPEKIIFNSAFRFCFAPIQFQNLKICFDKTATITWAVDNGIVNGKGDGVLDPLGKATRAEVATMLMRYCDKM